MSLVVFAGKNLYRVVYASPNIEMKAQRLVVATSKEEAMAHFGEYALTAELIEYDISMGIPQEDVESKAPSNLQVKIEESFRERALNAEKQLWHVGQRVKAYEAALEEIANDTSDFLENTAKQVLKDWEGRK